MMVKERGPVGRRVHSSVRLRGAGDLRSHGQPHWEEQSAYREEGLQLVENKPTGKTGSGPQAPARNWSPVDTGH